MVDRQKKFRSRTCIFLHISYVVYLFVLEGKIQDRSMCLFLNSLGCGSKKWKWLTQMMVLNFHGQCKGFISRTLRCLHEDRFSLEPDHPEFLLQKASLEDQRAQTQHRFLRKRLIGFMINVHFRVIGVHDTVLYCADFFTPILQNSYVQEFGTRMDEII